MEKDASLKEVKVTYETLYELLRLEKQRDEIQPLDKSFLMDTLNYLREKQQILDEAEQKQDLFSTDEREKTQLQLVNIRKIIRELYERREKKIIEMALNKSRTKSNIIDTTPLLLHEQCLFNSIVAVLDSYRSNVLHNILNLKEPTLQEQDNSLPVKPENHQATTQPQPPKNKAGIKLVKFTQPVDQFVGKELELYGPFQPEQQEQLPTEIADILISQGSAIEVTQE